MMMSTLGHYKTVVFHGEIWLGELEVYPVGDQNIQFPNNEIRILQLSPPSDRCFPLSVLHSIASLSLRCKLEPSAPVGQGSPLVSLHANCFFENKTAMWVMGGEEYHLVAMPSKHKKFPVFWCYSVRLGLYNSCSWMLNIRCLAIVFDLDETLIVASTMKLFEDRIESLRAWIAREIDPIRVQGMSAELKRVIDDRTLLKQYAENDCVVDNGKVFKAQMEEVLRSSENQESLVRPIIRLPDKNIVLTRINPENRDTSVLVRLRPAWEDLRSYLIAKGRKRFEVYVCTMAERDYALEMWRLLDPEAHLIGLKQLQDRIVCVKSGSKKSLLNVFQRGTCHPKMAMVIDDRCKVWEEKDQPRVHVVPPFTPYFAPQAETAHPVPVLCVARNVACNVRGYFFKEFDEIFLRRLSEAFYEDEPADLPPTPDVSNYMMSEDAGFVPNGINAPVAEGINADEIERRMNHTDEKHVDVTPQSLANNADLKIETSQPPVAINPSIIGPAPSATPLPLQRPSLLGNPVRRDNNSVKHNLGQPSPRLPGQISSSSVQAQGGWIVEEDCDGVNQNNRSGCTSNSSKNGEAPAANHLHKHGLPLASQHSEVGVSQNHALPNNMEPVTESGKLNLLQSQFSIGVLQEIGKKCSSKVEFRTVVSTSKDLQFSVEVLFTGEKIGVGMGKTRKDAQQQAAENALQSLADKYVAYVAPLAGIVDRDTNKPSLDNQNGFVYDTDPGPNEGLREDGVRKERTPEAADNEPEPGPTSSSLTNQQAQKRANIPSPRLPPFVQSKRTKVEQTHGSQSPLRPPKNGNTDS